MKRVWFAFGAFGALDTIVLLEFPSAGVLLLLLAIVGIASRPPRASAVGGLVVGIGGMWTFLMVRVKVSCDAFNAVPGQGCDAPGIQGWIVVGAVILAVGITVSVRVLRDVRARSRPLN